MLCKVDAGEMQNPAIGREVKRARVTTYWAKSPE
jgi:hypothetical protein